MAELDKGHGVGGIAVLRWQWVSRVRGCDGAIDRCRRGCSRGGSAVGGMGWADGSCGVWRLVLMVSAPVRPTIVECGQDEKSKCAKAGAT